MITVHTNTHSSRVQN